jgi:hypothetical protein
MNVRLKKLQSETLRLMSEGGVGGDCGRLSN